MSRLLLIRTQSYEREAENLPMKPSKLRLSGMFAKATHRQSALSQIKLEGPPTSLWPPTSPLSSLLPQRLKLPSAESYQPTILCLGALDYTFLQSREKHPHRSHGDAGLFYLCAMVGDPERGGHMILPLSNTCPDVPYESPTIQARRLPKTTPFVLESPTIRHLFVKTIY